MKTTSPFVCLLFCGAFIAPVTAQMIEDPVSDPNRWRLSGRFGFNIGADFENLGGFPAQTNPGPAAGGADHFYDDGYNRTDSRAVGDGLTWFWGYSNPSQLPGDGTVVMNSFSAPANQSLDGVDDDPQLGVELGYGRELGELGRARWGLEAALGYTRVEIDDGSALMGSAIRLSDAYSLGAAIPPAAPYSGTASGPGPLISDTPSRTTTTIPGGALITGRRELDASLAGLKLGPYVEIPITDRLSASINAGLAVAHIDAEFSFSETVTIPSMGPSLQPGVSNAQTRRGSESGTEWLTGGYGGLQMIWALTDQWTIFAGGEYQYLGTVSQRAGGKRARLDLGESIFLSGGLGFEF